MLDTHPLQALQAVGHVLVDPRVVANAGRRSCRMVGVFAGSLDGLLLPSAACRPGGRNRSRKTPLSSRRMMALVRSAPAISSPRVPTGVRGVAGTAARRLYVWAGTTASSIVALRAPTPRRKEAPLAGSRNAAPMPLAQRRRQWREAEDPVGYSLRRHRDQFRHRCTTRPGNRCRLSGR